jgi:LPXTG-motif cell wall-anchored protein
MGLAARKLRSIAVASALAAAVTLGTAAQADVITVTPEDLGESFTVDFNGYADGETIGGLTGQASFTLTAATLQSYTFAYEVMNTSSDPIDTSRISVFGFNTNPDIESASSTGEFDITATDANVPNGFGQVDVCFKGAGGSNSCSGGGGGGVAIGETGSGTLTLSFTDAVAELSLSDFFVRYQSVSGGGAPGSATGSGTISSSSGGSSSTSSGGTGSSSSTGGTEVPAPAGLGLFAVAAAALALLRRRRRSVRAEAVAAA